MALQERNISTGIAQGLDTKTDPKVLALGKLVDIQNGIFISPGRIKKRNGYAALPKSVFTGGSISIGNAIFTLNNQILMHDGLSLYSYDMATQTWRNVSKVVLPSGLDALGAPSIGISTTPIIRYGFSPGHPDMTIHPNGFTCVAWENATNGGVFFSLVGTATGNHLYVGQQLPVITTQADMRSPKVISVGNLILIFCINATSLYFYYIDTTNAAAGAQGPVLVDATIPAIKFSKSYDASVIGGKALVALATNASTIKTYTVDGSAAVVSRATFSATASACITVFPDYGAGQSVIAWSDATTGTNFTVYGADYTTVVVAPTQIDAKTAVTITGTTWQTNRTALLYTIAPINQSQSQNFMIRIRTYTAHAADGLPVTYARSVGLGGKVFVLNGQFYVPVIYDSLMQPTVFILDSAGMVVAKALPYSSGGQLVGAGNLSGTTQLPESNVVGSAATFASTEIVALGVAGIKSITATAGQKVTGDVLANTLHFGSGIVWMYDGVTMVEHGFHLFPEVVGVPNPGGSHVYSYTMCYEWTDAQGNLHRSAPAVPVTHAQLNPIDPSANAVKVTMGTLRLTRKPNSAGTPTPGSAVQCVLYRTIDTGTVYYRVAAVNQTPPLNDPTVDTIQFTDGVPDATLRANPILYTQGAGGAGTGRLENLAAQPPKFMRMVRNRMWYIDATNPLSLGYSQEVRPLFPVEFNGPGDGTLSFNLESRGGPAIAIANLDDKVVVFRQTAMSYIFGDGPAPDGSQNDFREIPIPANVGCQDPASVVSSEAGLVFKSSKGFYQLDRSLQTQYIGAPVEAYNQYTVTSAVQLPQTNWLLFTLSNGKCLLYDYYANQWSVFTNISAVDGGVYGNVHVWLDSAGGVHQETPGVYSDNGAYIPLSVKLAWAKLMGITGFQRVWEIQILGDWITAHNLKVDLAYDYNPTIVQTNTFLSTTSLTPYQLRVQCQKQECEAIQVTLTEQQNGGTIGEGLDLTAVSFAVGIAPKPSLYKMPASQTQG